MRHTHTHERASAQRPKYELTRSRSLYLTSLSDHSLSSLLKQSIYSLQHSKISVIREREIRLLIVICIGRRRRRCAF